MQLDFPISLANLNDLRSRAVLVPERAALFTVEGPGALECIQGLLTNDVTAAGDGSILYGAMLTSKGMIVLDPFVLRDGGVFVLILPAFVRDVARAYFARMLPPRLARVADRTGEWEVLWLLGAEVAERFDPLVRVPPPGRIARTDGGSIFVARAQPAMPFEAMLAGPAEEVKAFASRCLAAGMRAGDEASLATARVLAGWPSLGREIDDKTLPQEVRFDELNAVSYVKGCYTGQETVARVHFRGHPNRSLRGLVLDGGRAPRDRRLVRDARDVGVIRTAVVLQDKVLALATVRREVTDDVSVVSEDREARMVPLPVPEEVGV